MTLDGSASVAAICLAGILLWAAIAKLRNPSSTAEEFTQLGLPAIAARGVPLAEVAIALALIVLPGWGSVFAFFLLAAFTSILFTIVRSEATQSCNCFGRMSRKPVTWLDLARNAVLLGFSTLGSTIDRLHRPRIGEVIVIGGVAAAMVVYVLVSNRVQSSPERS